MKDELKPCPFCGGKGTLRKSNDNPPYIKVDHFCEHGRDAYHTHIYTKWCKTPDEAVNLWNRRAN